MQSYKSRMVVGYEPGVGEKDKIYTTDPGQIPNDSVSETHAVIPPEFRGMKYS